MLLQDKMRLSGAAYTAGSGRRAVPAQVAKPTPLDREISRFLSESCSQKDIVLASSAVGEV